MGESLEDAFTRMMQESSERQVIMEGEDFELVLMPKGYFGEQPEEFRQDSKAGRNDMCKSEIPLRDDGESSWLCTRREDHTGPHIAGYNDNVTIAIW